MNELLNDFSDGDMAHTYGGRDFIPTNEQRTKILALTSFGVPSSTIAKILDLPDESILGSCREEIAQAALDSQTAVLSAILDMAKSGKNVSATIFWLKTFGAHLLPTPPAKDDSQKSSGVEPQPLRFHVYNNDGEPNADY